MLVNSCHSGNERDPCTIPKLSISDVPLWKFHNDKKYLNFEKKFSTFFAFNDKKKCQYFFDHSERNKYVNFAT